MVRESFLTYLQQEKRCSPHTRAAYQQDLDSLSGWLAGQGKTALFTPEGAAAVKPRWLRGWISALLQEGLSRRSAARKLAAVSSFYRFLQREGLCAQNPARQVSLPRREKKLPDFLRESEAELLLEASQFPDTWEGARDRCLLELLYSCGLRRQEAISLNISNINSEQRLVRVQGKGRRERIVPYGSRFAEALSHYLEACRREGIALEGPLLLRRGGKPLYPNLVYRIVRAWTAQAGAGPRSPHSLRHSFATHLLDRGAGLPEIKDLLGHQSLAATEVYTHTTLARLKSVHRQAHPRSGATSNADVL
jgi:integrase/recombinase XerC